MIWFILAFLVGFLLITLPCLIYIGINKAWKDFLYDYFIFNFLYSTNEERVYFYTRIYSINFFVLNIGGITAFASIILCLIKKTERFYFDILYFVFMISVVLLTTMSAQTYLKMEIPILVTYVYPFSQLMNFANKEKNRIAKFTLVLYLSASYMVLLWADMINSSANDISNHFRGKEYNYSEDDLVKYIKDSTEKNDKIIVCGNCCQLYMYTDREPANKYIFLPPLEIEPGIVDEYFYLLADNPPKAIVMESTENELVRRMEEFTKENGYGEMHMENGRLSYPIYIRDDN